MRFVPFADICSVKYHLQKPVVLHEPHERTCTCDLVSTLFVKCSPPFEWCTSREVPFAVKNAVAA